MEFSGVEYDVIVKDGKLFIDIGNLMDYFVVSDYGEGAWLLHALDAYIRFDVEVQQLLASE